MSRFRQSTQVYNSNTYDDQTVIPSVGAAASYELTISTSNLELDMNNLRTLFSHVVSGSNGAFGSEPWYQGLSGRGVNTIDTDLESLENKTVLCRVSQDVDIAVAPSDDHVVLSAPGETPSQAIAIGNGIVTLPGAVVAQLAGAVGTASIDSVAASNAAAPKNLCILIDANTGDVLEDASNNQIFGLLQVGSGATDGGAFNNLSGTNPGDNAAQISFVTFDLGTNAFVLSAIPAGITDIRYAYVTRNTLEAVPEDCFLGFNSFVDGAASVDVTLSNAYANQGTTPAPLATNIFSQVPAAATNRSWSVTDSSANNIASFGTGAAATDLEVVLGTAALGVNSTTTINGDDLDINVANAMTVENGAVFEGGTANLSVNTAGNGNISSDDSLFINAATSITATATAGDITATSTAGAMTLTSQTGTAISSDGNVTVSANEASSITLDTQQDTAGVSGDINLTTGLANIGATQSSGDVNITTGDAGTGAVGNIQLEAGSNTSAGPAGGNIVLKSGDNLTASTVLIPRLLVRSSDAANVVDGQSVQLLTYENQSAGTGGGRNASVFVGNIAPSHNAQGGSIFHFSSAASDGALYINTSTGVGNTWEQVLTSSSGSLTLQAAYEGGNPVTPAGNTIVTTGGSAFDISGTEDVTLTGESRNLLGYTGTTAPAPTDGVFLATNGTASTIAEVGTLPTDTNSAQLQAFTGSTTGTGESGSISIFTGASEELSGNLTLSTGDATNSLAGSIEVTAGSSTNGAGGDVVQTAGDSGGGNAGGNFSIAAGAADAVGGNGGLMQVLGGSALNALSTGGNVQVTAGSNPLGTGGSALITGGNGSIAGGTGGDVRLTPGAGATPGVVEISTLQAETATVLRMTNTVESIDHFVSAATPEGAIAADPGSVAYVNNGGTGELYLKVSGAGTTLWQQVLTSGSSALTLQAAYDGGNPATPAGNTIVTTGGSALDVSGSEAISLDGTGNSNFTTDSGDLTLSTTTGGNVILNAAADNVDIDAGTAITMDAVGGVSIDGGAASNFTVNAGDLTLSTTGSGDIQVLAADASALNTSGAIINVIGGDGNGTGAGGDLSLNAGAGGTAGNGGSSTVQGGNGGATSGAGGTAGIFGGDAPTDGDGGDTFVRPGTGGSVSGSNGVNNIQSAGAAILNQQEIIARFANLSGGGAGQVVDLYAGATAPGAGFNANTGSIFSLDDGSTGALYINTSNGGLGDSWDQLLTSATISLTLQGAYEGGNTITTSAPEGPLVVSGTERVSIGSDSTVVFGSSGTVPATDAAVLTTEGVTQIFSGVGFNNLASGGDSVPVFVTTGAVDSTGNSGDMTLRSGTAADGQSGDVTLASGAQTGGLLSNTGAVTVATGAHGASAGSSGVLTLATGNSANSSSGDLALSTGNSDAASGDITIGTGTSVNTGVGATGSLALSTGAATTGDTGPISLTTGNASLAAGGISGSVGTSNTTGEIINVGRISFEAGDNAGEDRGGDIILNAGDNTNIATAADGGNVEIFGGDAAVGNGGDITFIPGAGGGASTTFGVTETATTFADDVPVFRYTNAVAGIQRFVSDASPEGLITGNPGDICHVETGIGQGQIYLKESGTGNMGWSQLATGGSTLTRTYFDGIIGLGGVPASTDILAGNISTTLTGAFPGAYGSSQADFDATFEVYINGQKLVNNGPGGGQVTRNVGGTAISLNFQLFAGDTIAIVSYT